MSKDFVRWRPQRDLDDLRLRGVSLAARGLLHGLRCLMAVSERQGYLVQGGEKLATAAISERLRATPFEVASGMAELLAAGLLAINESGLVYDPWLSATYKFSEHGSKGARSRWRPQEGQSGISHPNSPPNSPPNAQPALAAPESRNGPSGDVGMPISTTEKHLVVSAENDAPLSPPCTPPIPPETPGCLFPFGLPPEGRAHARGRTSISQSGNGYGEPPVKRGGLTWRAVLSEQEFEAIAENEAFLGPWMRWVEHCKTKGTPAKLPFGERARLTFRLAIRLKRARWAAAVDDSILQNRASILEPYSAPGKVSQQRETETPARQAARRLEERGAFDDHSGGLA